MATKAELEVELAALKKELDAAKEASADTVEASPIDTGALKKALADAGLAPEDIEAVWDQLSGELGALQQKNPMLTLVGAVALGFVLGRLSK